VDVLSVAAKTTALFRCSGLTRGPRTWPRPSGPALVETALVGCDRIRQKGVVAARNRWSDVALRPPAEEWSSDWPLPGRP
jgi:hypothetical protein